MQRTTQYHRDGLIASTLLALLLAACGSNAATTNRSPSPSPTPTGTLSPVPTPNPTAVPTPAPEPPLAVFFNYQAGPGGQQMEVVNGEGVEQWGLTNAQEGQFFGLTAEQASTDNLAPQMGGSNLFFFYQPTPTSANQVAVVSRSDQLVGHGTAPALNPNLDNGNPFQVSPTGTEWAWTIDQTPTSTGKHQGIVEVGGIGEVSRVVYRWVAPAGYTEQLVTWTNAGIIMQRTPQGGPFPCGGDQNADYVWFAINPGTDTLTELFTGNNQFQDASSGVTAATLLNDPHAALINGVTYAESKSIVYQAAISPSGANVGVLRETFNPCGGGDIPETSIEMVFVASHTHVDLQNLQFGGWWGDGEIAAYPPDNAPPPPGASGFESASLWVYTLLGKPVSQICPVNTQWLYQGALS